MKQVEFLDKSEKMPSVPPVELTHGFHGDGMYELTIEQSQKLILQADRLIFIGNSRNMGDAFVLITPIGQMFMYYGKLNSSFYQNSINHNHEKETRINS